MKPVLIFAATALAVCLFNAGPSAAATCEAPNPRCGFWTCVGDDGTAERTCWSRLPDATDTKCITKDKTEQKFLKGCRKLKVKRAPGNIFKPASQ